MSEQKRLDDVLMKRFREGLLARGEDVGFGLTVDGVVDDYLSDHPNRELWRIAVQRVMAAEAERWLARIIDSAQVAGSPLEEAMLLALTAVGASCTDSPLIVGACCEMGPGLAVRDSPQWCGLRPAASLEVVPTRLQICQQHMVGRYRADFILRASTLNHDNTLEMKAERLVVVEVDGHDFHERTKEQARHDKVRDRFMQRSGLVVLRFTGSEVYANPIKCATEAVLTAFDPDGEKGRLAEARKRARLAARDGGGE